MAKLPRLSGNELLKCLTKVGFTPQRQKGSHVIMSKEVSTEKITLVVLTHKEIDTGTLREIIRQARLTREEFMELIK